MKTKPWISPADAPPPDPEAVRAINAAIAKFPELTDHGFGVSCESRLDKEARAEAFRRDRADMFTPFSVWSSFGSATGCRSSCAP